MRAPLRNLLRTVIAEAKRAREREAAKLLHLETVRSRIIEAAHLGQSELLLMPAAHLDVRGTEAACRLEAWCRDEGLRLSWETRDVDTPDGRRITVAGALLSWVHVPSP